MRRSLQISASDREIIAAERESSSPRAKMTKKNLTAVDLFAVALGFGK